MQAKLLNSISSSFDDAMKHPQSKIEFLDQFAMIVKGVSVSTEICYSSLKYLCTSTYSFFYICLLQDALKQQETLMKQNEKQVEELKNTHQNVSDSFNSILGVG